MGSAVYEPQHQILLERFRRVILLLDGDPTGRKGEPGDRSKITATLFRPSNSVGGESAAGPNDSRGHPRGSTAVRQRRLLIR